MVIGVLLMPQVTLVCPPNSVIVLAAHSTNECAREMCKRFRVYSHISHAVLRVSSLQSLDAQLRPDR
jgi:hypothetical protein